MARWLEDRSTAKAHGRPFGAEKPDGQRGIYNARGRGGRGGWGARGRGGTAYPTDRRGVFAVLQDEEDSTEDPGEKEEASVRTTLGEEEKV